MNGRRAEAVKTLKAGLTGRPRRRPPGWPCWSSTWPSPPRGRARPPPTWPRPRRHLADVARAARRRRGRPAWPWPSACTRPASYELALPWAERAADQARRPGRPPQPRRPPALDGRGRRRDPAEAAPLLQRAVAAVRPVLAGPAQLGRGHQQQGVDPPHATSAERREALALAEGLAPARRRRGPCPASSSTPSASIQEASGSRPDAEESYAKGLRKAPEHPVLNYHMGRLIAADQQPGGQGQRLPPEGPGRPATTLRRPIAAEVDDLAREDRPLRPLRPGPPIPTPGAGQPAHAGAGPGGLAGPLDSAATASC